MFGEIERVLKDIVPLLQTLCWPLLLILFVLWLHNPIGRFIRVIVERVEKGEPFEVSSSGKLDDARFTGRTAPLVTLRRPYVTVRYRCQVSNASLASDPPLTFVHARLSEAMPSR